MDKLKDVIEDFLRKRMKSQLQTEPEVVFNWDRLTDKQENEIEKDARIIVNTLLEFSRLLPLSYRLIEIGKLLEREGKIVRTTEAYDELAVNYFCEMLDVNVPNAAPLH